MSRGFRLLMAAVLVAVALPVRHAVAEPDVAPKRVIIVHSFGRQFEPFSSAAAG